MYDPVGIKSLQSHHVDFHTVRFWKSPVFMQMLILMINTENGTLKKVQKTLSRDQV